MVLGMSLATFTLQHVVISLVGIATGFVVVYGMLNANRLTTWTAIFLATTVLTSVTGFFFPFEKLLPSHIFGVISLVVLAPTLLALYVYRSRGHGAGSTSWVQSSRSTSTRSSASSRRSSRSRRSPPSPRPSPSRRSQSRSSRCWRSSSGSASWP